MDGVYRMMMIKEIDRMVKTYRYQMTPYERKQMKRELTNSLRWLDEAIESENNQKRA